MLPQGHFGLNIYSSSFSLQYFAISWCCLFLILLFPRISTFITAAVFCVRQPPLYLIGWQMLICVELEGAHRTFATFSGIFHRDLETSGPYMCHRSSCTLSQILGCTSQFMWSPYILHPAIMRWMIPGSNFAQSATWVLLALVDSCLYGSGACCPCAVLQAGLFYLLGGFLDVTHFLSLSMVHPMEGLGLW